MPKPKNNLVTKDYLDKKLQDFKVELKSELKVELKSELLEIEDRIVGEIKAMRKEFDVHQASHARINDTLEDHENRLSALKSHKP